MYDLIGDIHGHADELLQLLETLGYQKVHRYLPGDRRQDQFRSLFRAGRSIQVRHQRRTERFPSHHA